MITGDQRNFRQRIADAFPVFSALLRHRVTYKPLVTAMNATATGSPGKIAVTGILAGDELAFVFDVTTGAVVTSEFVANTVTSTDGRKGTIAEDGYIDNTGGTLTATDNLLVVWLTWENR